MGGGKEAFLEAMSLSNENLRARSGLFSYEWFTKKARSSKPHKL